MRRYLKWIGIAVLLIVVALGAYGYSATRPAEPMPQAFAALQSDAQVQVETETWLVFRPRVQEPTTGFIFYPGGLVDPRAYAPMAREIAARGYLVVVVPMPLNLAFFGTDHALDVMHTYPAIRHWAIGGHSLGGVAAAMFIQENPDAVQGLALWASYPAPADNLSSDHLKTVSIYGTQDQLATGDKIAASRPLLPPTTHWVAIEGGNHGQFGWYGVQTGDGAATISREQQQEEIVNATTDLLSTLGG